jgi:hypothetical protein
METETIQIEGNIETSYLLEQVFHFSNLPLGVSTYMNCRLKRIAERFDILELRTHISGVRICYERFKRSLHCKRNSSGHLRHHWNLLDCQTLMTTLTLNLRQGHLRHYGPWLQRRNSCIAMLSSFRLLLVSWICLWYIRKGQMERRWVEEVGYRGRRCRRIRFGNGRWRLRSWIDGWGGWWRGRVLLEAIYNL